MDFGRCGLVKVQVAPPEFRKNLFVGWLVSGRGTGIYVRCTVFRMAGGGRARKRGAGLACVVTAALAIVFSGALAASGQDAGANTSHTDEVAGNPASEPARSSKSVDSFEGPANYTFLVAAGVLCDSSESGGCPAVVKSTNGDGYRLSGAGTFSARGGSAAGAGTFTHETSLGVPLESGVWVLEQLVTFDSYGLGPSPILKDPKVIGPARLGPRRMPGPLQSMAAGGRAVFRVRMLPIVGPSRMATLEINCAAGQPPAERQVDGIKLAFEGGGLQFEEQGPLHSLFVVGPTIISK